MAHKRKRERKDQKPQFLHTTWVFFHLSKVRDIFRLSNWMFTPSDSEAVTIHSWRVEKHIAVNVGYFKNLLLAAFLIRACQFTQALCIFNFYFIKLLISIHHKFNLLISSLSIHCLMFIFAYYVCIFKIKYWTAFFLLWICETICQHTFGPVFCRRIVRGIRETFDLCGALVSTV